MKNVFKLLFFVIYIIAIFSLKNYKILGIYIIINLVISKMLNAKFLAFLKNIKIIMILVIFTAIINIIFGSIEDGIVLGIRILIAYNFTYIFSTTFDILEFAQTIEIILKPLYIFKINVKDISLIISIALCMIPILSEELEQTKNSLKSKGYKFKLNNLDLYIKPIMISILKRTDELEKTLIVKGYLEQERKEWI